MTIKVKIPKRVAGVKLPKKMRRKAKKAFKVAASPRVRQFAAAMGAAARASGDAKAGGSACRSATIHIDGARLGEAFRAAALDGLRRFLEGFEEGLREAAAETGENGPPKRPPSAASPGAGAA